MSRMIFVTFQKEGIHCYPAAPEGVEFLKHPHRHMFHHKIYIEVFHNDRDLEFILVKREIESWYDTGVLELDHQSCEMISDNLFAKIYAKWPHRKVVIEISEDGENGSYTTYGD